jgi:hypothetical protein
MMTIKTEKDQVSAPHHNGRTDTLITLSTLSNASEDAENNSSKFISAVRQAVITAVRLYQL